MRLTLSYISQNTITQYTKKYLDSCIVLSQTGTIYKTTVPKKHIKHNTQDSLHLNLA
jgi:hypothetical protein